MQIFVKYNKIHTFEIFNDITVEELKDIISECLSIPKNYFYLTYTSKKLDNKLLSEYNISDLSRINVELRHC
jgi:hypothetical protein